MPIADVTRSAGTALSLGFAEWVDDQGRKMWRMFNDSGAAHSARAVLRVTWLKEADHNGWPAAAALTTTTSERQKVIVASEAVADQAWGDYFVGGPNVSITVASLTYTAGNGVRVDNSSAGVVDGGAQAGINIGAGTAVDFGAIMTGLAAAGTSIKIFLFDRETTVQA